MSLAGLVQDMVAVAKTITTDFQESVTIQPWVGHDGYGADSYGTTATYKAIVEKKTRQRFMEDGRVVLAKAYVAIVEPIANTTANSGFTRQNPLDNRDILTLADGTTGPIVETRGLVNPESGKPYLLEVWLGDLRGGAASRPV